MLEMKMSLIKYMKLVVVNFFENRVYKCGGGAITNDPPPDDDEVDVPVILNDKVIDDAPSREEIHP